MVIYDSDSNEILVEPINIRNVFLKIHKVLKARRSNTKVYIMDNEYSSDLKEAMKKYEIDFQLAPPHMHRQDSAQRAIRTCKNHFTSGFSMTDTNISISEWDQLLSQCVITLLLLRNSRVNPDLSSYA